MSLETTVRDYLQGPDSPLTDEQQQILNEDGGWIAGGAISSLLCGREIRDIDIYVPSFEVALKLATTGYVISGSDKAIVLGPKGRGHPPVQIVHNRYYQSPDEIFKVFDFTACMGSYSLKDNQLTLHDDFISANLARELRFNKNTLYPIMSALRVEKYKEYGYKISTLEQLKIFTAISQLDISELSDLKEQIGGMYGDFMSISNVETLDQFFDAQSVNLTIDKVEPPTVDYTQKLIEHNIPSLNNILVKAVLPTDKDGCYTSMMAADNAMSITYEVGTILDTDNITPRKKHQHKSLFASGIKDTLLSGKEAQLLVMRAVEKRPVTGTAWVDPHEYAGKFKILAAPCSVKEWNKMEIFQKIDLIKKVVAEEKEEEPF